MNISHKILLNDDRDNCVSVSYFQGLDFDISLDRPFINILQAITRNQAWLLPNADDLLVDHVVQSGLINRSHLVNTMVEDPSNFHYEVFSPRYRTGSIGDQTGMRLNDTFLGIRREFVLFDAAFTKRHRSPLLSQVEMKLDGSSVKFRRLAVPLSRNGKDVSEFYIAFSE